MRRSYTFSFMIVGDLFLAVWFGFNMVYLNNVLSSIPLFVCLVSFGLFLVRSHWTYFNKSALTQIECFISAFSLLLIPVLTWLIVSFILTLFGAEPFS